VRKLDADTASAVRQGILAAADQSGIFSGLDGFTKGLFPPGAAMKSMLDAFGKDFAGPGVVGLKFPEDLIGPSVGLKMHELFPSGAPMTSVFDAFGKDLAGPGIGLKMHELFPSGAPMTSMFDAFGKDLAGPGVGLKMHELFPSGAPMTSMFDAFGKDLAGPGVGLKSILDAFGKDLIPPGSAFSTMANEALGGLLRDAKNYRSPEDFAVAVRHTAAPLVAGQVRSLKTRDEVIAYINLVAAIINLLVTIWTVASKVVDDPTPPRETQNQVVINIHDECDKSASSCAVCATSPVASDPVLRQPN
jgi:hypothetical protein